MIRLIGLLLFVKNFIRLYTTIFNIAVNIIDLTKHVFRGNVRNFQFSLKWNYAIRKIFNKKSILYHIIYFIVISLSFIYLSYLKSNAVFDLEYFYIVLGVYTFTYYFTLSFMMNWYQQVRNRRRDTPDIDNFVPDNNFNTPIEPDDEIINSVEDLYDV